MKAKPVGFALIALGVLAWIVVGGIALVDGVFVGPRPTPTNVTRSIPSPTVAIVVQPSVLPTLTVTATSTVTPVQPSSTSFNTAIAAPVVPTVPTVISVITATAVPLPTTTIAVANGCPPPTGWVVYHIQDGDTLFGFQLGAEGKVDVKAIMQANCLKSTFLTVGQAIYLPPGAAEHAPKADDSGGAAVLPAGATRKANCPCAINVVVGWRVEQIAAAVDKNPVGFSGRDFLATVAPNALIPPQFGFLSSRPAGKSLEGFMLPGVYTLNNDTSAIQFRDMMLSAFGQSVTPDIQAAITKHGLSLWEGVVLASIVQREAHEPDVQKIAASIFYNRIAKQMGLASFATLQYALGQPGNWWPRITGSNIHTDTRYNTSKYLGLTPSPIANPGIGAIMAVAYPAQTEYLYMNARCDGNGNFYAKTWEEFQQGLNC